MLQRPQWLKVKAPIGQGREAIQAEGQACYRTFITSLLDITDNIVNFVDNIVLPVVEDWAHLRTHPQTLSP